MLKKDSMKIFILIFCIIIIPSVFAQSLNDGLVDYWSFNDDNYTGDISKTGTNTNTIRNTTGVIGDSRSFYVNQYITMPTNASFNNPALSYCYFVHYFGNLKDTNRAGLWKGSTTNYWYNWAYENSGSDIVDFATNGLTDSNVVLNVESGTYKEYANYSGVWTSYCFVVNNSNASIYVNGTLAVSESKTGSLSNDNSGIVFGKFSTNYLNGQFDEVAYWNRSITSQEVEQYYNNVTSGQGYPFPLPIPPNTTILNITFTAKNYYNIDFGLSNFTLQFNNNGTNYTTTNGTIILYNFNVSNLVNISVTGMNNHYDVNYSDVNLSSGSYILRPLNILNFSSFNIYSSGYFNYNQSQLIKWSIPMSLINASISRYNATLTGSNSNVVFVVTNDSSTNFTSYNFLNYFDQYTLRINVVDEFGLTSSNSTSNFYVRPSITPCNESIIVNSTGVTLSFNLTNKIPSPILPIQAGQGVLQLGASNVIAYSFPSSVTFYNYSTMIYNGSYFNVTTGFNGAYTLYANEIYTGYTSTLCTLSLCVNKYERIQQPCVDNLRYINYTDTNNCGVEYDVPMDRGTYEDCLIIVPPTTDKDLWLILLLLVIWIIGLILSLRYSPLIMIMVFIDALALAYYTNEYFGEAILSMGIVIITTFMFFVVVMINRVRK